LAANRVLFGIGYLIWPDRVGFGWIGRSARRPQTQVLTRIHVLTRALGAREEVLGLGALAALRNGGAAARPWFAAHLGADATDVAATLIARDDLPRSGFRFATAMAGASTAVAALGAAQPADLPPRD